MRQAAYQFHPPPEQRRPAIRRLPLLRAASQAQTPEIWHAIAGATVLGGPGRAAHPHRLFPFLLLERGVDDLQLLLELRQEHVL